nr:Unknown Function [uncultured bacterium]
MDEKRRREAQASLSVAIQTLLEAIPNSAFEAFHPENDADDREIPIDDARLLLAGEMMASAYLLLEKKVEPRDVVLNTWDLIATMTGVLSVDHIADMLPVRMAKAKKPAEKKAAPAAKASKATKSAKPAKSKSKAAKA